MEMIKRVARSYGMDEIKIEKITDALYRISDRQNKYALKKSILTNQSIPIWENVFQQANSKQLLTILPVYLTNNRSLYLEMDKNIYYITPWIDTNEVSIDAFYRSLGKIHAQTKQVHNVNSNKITDHFKGYQSYCQNASQKLLSYVQQFESNRYMSPFELQVCTHYRDLVIVFKKISERIQKFVEIEEEQLSWSYCLCHGNLELSHILGQNNISIINWERAKIDNPTSDLTTFFKNETTTYDAPIKLLISSFSNYMGENKLTINELNSLLIHLMDPINYFSIVQQYINQGPETSMIKHVKKLQQTYRQLLFGLQFSDHIEKEYENILLNDLEN